MSGWQEGRKFQAMGNSVSALHGQRLTKLQLLCACGLNASSSHKAADREGAPCVSEHVNLTPDVV